MAGKLWRKDQGQKTRSQRHASIVVTKIQLAEVGKPKQTATRAIDSEVKNSRMPEDKTPAVALPLSVDGNLPKQNEYFQFQLHHDQKYAMFPCRAGDREMPTKRARARKLRRLASAAPIPTSAINNGISGAVPSRMSAAAQLEGR